MSDDQAPPLSACPVCDRAGAACPTMDTLVRGTLPNTEVRKIAIEAMRDCRSRAVDWRAEALRHRADRATLAALAAEWRQGYIGGDDRTAADCAYRIEDLLSGGGS